MASHRLYLTLVVAAGIGFLALLDQTYRTELRLENQRQLSEAATAIQRDLTKTLQGLTEAVANLQAFMLAGNALPDTRAFDRFAENLIEHHPALNALVHVGPDRIVRHVFPLEPHRGAIGLDLSKRPSAAYVEKAITERRMVVDDPHHIVSGELAILARAPLYRGDEFQGLAQGIFNISAIVGQDLQPWSSSYLFNLRDRHGRLFWGQEFLPGDVQERVLSVGDSTWMLTVGRAPRLPRTAYMGFLLIWGGGGALVGLVTLHVHRRLGYTRRLNEAVETKTRELAESERMYRALMENASDAILVVNADGRFFDANHCAEELLGYSESELMQLGPPDIHPPDDQQNLEAAFVDMEEKGASLYEHLVVRKDGTTVPVEVAGTRIELGGSHVYLGIFRDISERKRTEQELERYRNRLEQLVEERTEELAAANRELEAFSYSVSHDLRAPLRAINGFGEALREDYGEALDAVALSYIDRMRTATTRMGELIDGLLNLSRVMRSELAFTQVELSTIAAEIAHTLQEQAPERSVSWQIQPGLLATGDRTLLRLLLQNLLENAWKFTARTPQAQIAFGREKQAGQEVYYVRDSGAGFEMQYAHKLFQPFERLHRSEEFEGTGIGLATVRRIVQRHGGRVWAEGAPQQGAAIYFTLKATADKASA